MNATLQEETQTAGGRPFPRFLASGMHLSQPEFHRYYELEPDNIRAELVKGIVFMASPQSKWHGDAVGMVSGCLATYSASMSGVRSGLSASIILDFSNEYQPDVHLRLDEEYGGQCQSSGEFLKNAPELIVEVSLSSFAYDLHEKLEVYQNHRVREYIVWRGDKNLFSCFRLEGDSFVDAKPGSDGIFRSAFFRGLWLDTAALARSDLRKALEIVQDGLNSPEAKEFKADLERRKVDSD